MQSKPLVSIFLPYYNDKKFIKDAIEGVLNQTYQNWELFLFNHASTDGSRKIAHDFNDFRIKHIDANENLGAGSGLNSYNCLNLMNGKYIKFFCADDVMLPNCLEEMVNYLEKNQNIDFVFSNTYLIDDESNFLKKTWFEIKAENGIEISNIEENILKLLFMRHSPIPFPAVLLKKTDLKPEYLDKSYIHLFDVNLWTNLLFDSKRVGIINEPLISYRKSKNQITKILEDSGDLQATFFEVVSYQKIFFKVKKYEQLRILCPLSPFIDLINEHDVWAFEFIIAHYMLYTIINKNVLNDFASYIFPIQIVGYQKIHDIFENDILREKIRKRFNFGIKDFRKMYTYYPKKDDKKHVSLKQMIYLKNPKKLSSFDILFLIARKIFNLITLKFLINFIKSRRKKQVEDTKEQ